jgi:hypothetical protein
MTDAEDTLAAENRRLVRELEEAERELRALKASRWRRLNPRAGLTRLRRDRIVSPARIGRTEPSAVSTTGGGESVDPFRVEVFDRGTFSEDWYLRRVNAWPSIFRELEGRRAQLLEIGSYEGLSACFMLWRLPDAVITCIDTFEGGLDNRASNADLSGLESRFDANLALFGAARVRKLVGDSRRRLLDLGAEDSRFDLVYIDGSHLGLDVIVDAALAWPLLEPGGILIFDDYRWAQLGDDPLLRPGVAIDSFLDLVAGKFETLFAEHQLAIRKLEQAERDP